MFKNLRYSPLEVEVEHVSLPTGSVFDVLVDNVKVGELRLNSEREGKLELSTRNGQRVPTIVNGTTVSVVDVSSRNVVVRGAFSVVPSAASPTPTASATPRPTATPGSTPSPTPTATPRPLEDKNLKTKLVGTTINGVMPKGEAEFEQRSGGSRQLQVQVEDVNLPAGTILNVLLDGRKIGEIALRSSREGKFELNLVTSDQSPPVVNGSTIIITYGSTRETLLAGTFRSSNTTSVNPSPVASRRANLSTHNARRSETQRLHAKRCCRVPPERLKR